MSTPTNTTSTPTRTGTAATPGKKDFTDLYTGPDPRAYMRYFADQDYRVLASGAELVRRVVDTLGDPGPLVDVCCSYGQDAALLNHHVDGRELFAHYTADDVAGLPHEDLLARDRTYFAARRREGALTLLGLDASAPAVAYGVASGLLADAVAVDAEAEAAVDLSRLGAAGGVMVTGGIGYVGPRTFNRLLDACDGRPWVAGMVLRWVDLDPLADALRQRGYRVQVAESAPVVQRRIADDVERVAMLEQLRVLGREVGPVEAGGHHAAVPFLAVPAEGPVPGLGPLAAGLDALT